jgi:parallel beta-helix repeat protein
MKSSNVKWIAAGVLLLCLFGTVVSAYSGRIIEQGMTVYIGEEGLNITHALNKAQGSPVDGVPPNTLIGWWPSATDPYTTSPSQVRSVGSSYPNFYVAPSDYTGFTGAWYIVSGGHASGSAVFYVSNPTPVSSCQVISSPGYYILQTDIIGSTNYACIDITASNVTFDGNGHTINSGTAPSLAWQSKGIQIWPGTPVHNNVIKNTKLTNWYQGIKCWQSDNMHVYHNQVSDAFVGIDIGRADGSLVNANDASSNFGDGFSFTWGNNVDVLQNTANDNIIGFAFQDISGFKVNDNIANDALQSNFYAGSVNGNTGNIFNNNTMIGGNTSFSLQDGNYLSTFSNNTLQSYQYGFHMYVNSSGNTFYKNSMNTAKPSSFAVLESTGSDNHNDFIDNSISGGYYGISLNGDGNVVSGNTISGTSIAGISIQTLYNSVNNNRGSANTQSFIQFNNGYYNTLFNNTASGNGYGYRLVNASQNHFGNNTVVDSTNYGIVFDGPIPSVYNEFADNYFNNTDNVYWISGTGANYWNTNKQAGPNILGGSLIGGNFWSNPSGTGYSQTCTDADSDGFCDTPFTVNTGNIDQYPLSQPGLVIADYSALPTNGTIPLIVTFRDLSKGSPTGRYMEFGDGTEANFTINTLTHTYNKEGTFFPVIHAWNSVSSDAGRNGTISVNVSSGLDPDLARAYNVLLNDPAILGGNTVGITVSASQTKLPLGVKTANVWGAKPAITLPNGEGWFFLIDDFPEANWEHPCRYGFVDNLNIATVYHSWSPPRNINLARISGLAPAPEGMKAISSTPVIPLATMSPAGAVACTPDCTHNYALLLSGGFDPNNNHKRYYNDILSMYKTLTTTYGYPKDHIWVLMSDGTSPVLDRHYADSKTSPVTALTDDSPTAADFVGAHIGDASLNTLRVTLQTDIPSKITSDDNLYIFTTNHGGNTTNPASKDVIFYLWDGESITDTEFVSLLPSSAKSITMIMEQCFGGGFADNFITSYTGTQKRVIVTAANYNQFSWGNAFSTPWIAGITTPMPADTTFDGRSSMYEAFIYARKSDTYLSKETPQYFVKNIDGKTQFLSNCTATPTIIVTTPNTVETWVTGTNRTITWAQTGLSGKMVNIELWRGSESANTAVKTADINMSVDATLGKSPWWIPANIPAGTDYWVKMYQTDDGSISDRSDSSFIIRAGGGAGAGRFIVNSVPVKAAVIWIDGSSSARATNYTFPSTVAGTHSVGLVKSGYYAPVSQVYIPNGGTATLTIQLDPVATNDCHPYGKMVIRSSPVQDAAILVDGAPKGNTNAEIEAAPGPHTVSVKRNDYIEPPAQQVIIPDPVCGQDRIVYADFTLVPINGNIPEFPSSVISLILIIGFLGTVMYIRNTRNQ